MELRTDRLRVTIDDRTVLDAISVAFRPGRVTAVMGANGAGKSTLLRALTALVPAAGVTLEGRDVAAMPARERARAIGYLPQGAAVHWNISVRDLVALGRLPHPDRGRGPGAAAIDAALAATGTAALAARPVRSLSGGERARVMLARVLAGEPHWLLADEPMAALDPLHQRETAALLRAAAARGTGVVVVLHDLTLAARVADDVVLLKDGAVLAQGAAAEVLTEATIAAAFGVKVAIVARPEGPVIVPDLMI